MPKEVATFWPAAFNLLPDFAGYVIAMAGVALIFMPDDLKKLEGHRKIRLIIAGLIFLLGLGAILSNSVQKQQDKEVAEQDKNDAKADRVALMNQVTVLVEAERHYQHELSETRQKLSNEINIGASGLQAQIDRVQKSAPPTLAKLAFASFSKDEPDFSRTTTFSRRDENGVVEFQFIVRNYSSVAAVEPEMWVTICSSCSYTKEPEGFVNDGGKDEQHVRHKKLPNLNPGVRFVPMNIDIIPPKGITFFDVAFTYSCQNCGGLSAPSILKVFLLPTPKAKLSKPTFR